MTTTTRLMRMRTRQAGRADVARVMYPARRPVLTAGDRLGVVLGVVGVTDRDRAVIAARLAGGTFGDAAAAVKVTRQRAQQIERDILRRLGLAGSVEDIVHAGQRLAGADLAHGRAADAGYGDVGRGGWVNLTAAERRHEAAVARFLRSKGEKA